MSHQNGISVIFWHGFVSITVRLRVLLSRPQYLHALWAEFHCQALNARKTFSGKLRFAIG
jgi:hypothetical protein